MVIGIEGVGEAVTGGMIARAVEPGAGEADDGHTHETNCLNCGTALTGPYCHQCGQQGHVHRTLSAFFHDLLHGVFHFEGKIWRTLPMLAFKPGDLTRRYIAGERARFVSPMALFLFSVFLMFAVIGLVGGPVASSQGGAAAKQESISEVERAIQETRRREAGLVRQRQALAARNQPTAAVDAQLSDLRSEIRVLETGQRLVTGTSARRDRVGDRPMDVRDMRFNTSLPWLDHALEKASENPSLLVYKLQNNAYKFSWALIPISVPFVWLMFLWRRRYRVYDHTVFVTYSLAFMTLLVVTLSLIRPIVGTDVIAVLVLTFWPPIHMYKQLKYAYGLRRFSAIWRTFILLWFAAIAASLYFMMLLTIGALG
jgi:hypothetical protein